MYLLIPFTKEGHETRSQNQYLSSIIRMEFEVISDTGVQPIKTRSALLGSSTGSPGSRFSTPKQSYVLKSVEFFFDF